MEELISVIVPVHNAEKYLPECIDSIITQSYQNLEIILVDDCSDDRSPSICDDYAKKDSRIYVIHREVKGGEGGAKARNDGIDHASGSVFYFMDSDDYIESNMLARMYDIMCREQSECVVSSFHYADSEGNELSWRVPELSSCCVMSGKEAAKIFLTTLNIEGFSWNKLFRREILMEHQIRFDESMNSFVDMYGMFRAILNCSKVSFYDAKPYYYRQHNVSCVHTMNQRKLGNYKRVISQITALADENGMTRESSFFCSYRMTLQLFDTVKAKKNYDKAVWKQIRQEYKWSVIFGRSLWKVYQKIFSYRQQDRMKTGIKLFLVWINFK